MEWARPNDGQEVEAITMKKVVTEGESGVGVAVQMQYREEIWKVQILSLHGKTASCILWVFLFCVCGKFYSNFSLLADFQVSSFLRTLPGCQVFRHNVKFLLCSVCLLVVQSLHKDS